MLIEYVGPQRLPLELNTPIPFLSHSSITGMIAFNPTCDVTNQEWAEFLLKECGDAFREVKPAEPESPKPVKPAWEPPIGKRFNGKPGKWQGKAYIKKHGLEQTHGLKKRSLGDKVFGWELVPIALADVGVEQAPISDSTEGQEEVNGHGDSGRDQGIESDDTGASEDAAL